jgi:hypothetical protein
MLRPEYLTAIERRLAWAQAMEPASAYATWTAQFHGAPFDAYRYTLTHGDLYVMAPKFCEMVEGARRSVPDDLAFELPWVLSPAGWCWFATPFQLPFLQSQVAWFRGLAPIDQLAACLAPLAPAASREQVRVQLAAVTDWLPLLASEQADALHALTHHYAEGVDGDELLPLARALQKYSGQRAHAHRITTHAMAWYRNDQVATERRIISSSAPIRPDLTVLFFGDHGVPSFVPLAHLGVQDGARLGPRVDHFEAWAAEGYAEHPDRVDAPYGDPTGMWRHEIRLAYTVFHLMAQRLTAIPRVPVDRATRRRAERAKQIAPAYVEVVTLRRLEADRRRDPTGETIDWQWQWSVVGHWRWQWYPSEGTHKRIWIHQFTKGPADKPFKAPGAKLFVARR